MIINQINRNPPLLTKKTLFSSYKSVNVAKKMCKSYSLCYSIRFYNPAYGLEAPDPPKSVLLPGQHEYSNPVECGVQEVQNSGTALLQKVQPLNNVDY